MTPAAEKMREWRERPDHFVREVFAHEGWKGPDAWQIDVLTAATTQQRIALKASKGPGKSTVLAWLLWWWMCTRLHPKVIATSVTAQNLSDGLWAETSKWQRKSRLLQALFTWSADRIVAKQHRETWWASARSWPKSADPQRQADTLAGVHADNVLFLLDEAGGIPDAVAATAEAGLANANEAEGREARLVLAGNPTQTDGPLYRACTRERALWWVKEISGDPDDPKRAPRVSKEWAREQIEKYGREHPFVLVNVFGKFPPGSSNALINVDDVTAAMAREVPRAEWEQEPKVMGIDVAREGDDRSVFFLRQGHLARRPQVFRIADTMEIADRAARFIIEHEPDGVFVDEAGFGAGVLDRLRQLGHRALGVKFGGPALKSEYANRRSEMWHGMAKWLPRACLPDMSELVQELTAPTYGIGENGKLLLEKKKDIKRRIGVSPDLADALALTFAAPVAHRKLRELQERNARQRKPFNPFDRLEAP